ncbi:MAG: hypothetical protein LUH02_00965 [Erysipelotrichaceae bacterium]|nr:hypothetical protein [Erysipelotrichaceae bacterium]
MSQKISDEAFQKGYQLYQNNQVSPIKQNNNLYSANVRDKQYYRVVIMVNDKRKMTKMNCTCPKARIGEPCEHEAAVYLKLKNEYHIFASDEDTSFLGYYQKQEYDKAIDALSKRTQSLISQCRFDNMKQTLNGLTNLLSDYNQMTLSIQYKVQIEDIFNHVFHSFLAKKDASSYYLTWLEEIINNQSLTSIVSLICQLNNFLPSQDLIPVYLRYLEQFIDKSFYQYIITYMLNHIKELSKADCQILINQLPNDSQEYQYILLYQYLNDHKMAEVQTLYQQLKDVYDLTDVEVAIYKYQGDIPAFQQYVIKHYQKLHDFSDLSLLKDLKEMYGHSWQTAQFEVMDAVLKDVNDTTYQKVLTELECFEYQAYHYMKFPKNIIPYELVNYMKEKDNQVYLMMLEQKYKSMIKKSNKYNYHWIRINMENELKGNICKIQQQELAYDLMIYFSDDDLNKELMLLLGE